MTPSELDALAVEAEEMRRNLARRIACERVTSTALPLDEAMATALRQCDDKWPRFAALIAEYAGREPTC